MEKAEKDLYQLAAADLKKNKKCIWCGDVKAGFYHSECALEMSKSNYESALKILGATQKELKIAKEKLIIFSDLLSRQTKLIEFYLREQ